MMKQHEPVTLFYCYAHEDEALRDQLEKHLSLLRQKGLISSWHDREILSGAEWTKEIDAHLDPSQPVVPAGTRHCSAILFPVAVSAHPGS